MFNQEDGRGQSRAYHLAVQLEGSDEEFKIEGVTWSLTPSQGATKTSFPQRIVPTNAMVHKLVYLRVVKKLTHPSPSLYHPAVLNDLFKIATIACLN